MGLSDYTDPHDRAEPWRFDRCSNEPQRRAISIDFASWIEQAHADRANRAAEINLDHLAEIAARSVSWLLLWVLHPDLGEFHLLGSQHDARRTLALAVVDRDAAKRTIRKARGELGRQHDRISHEFGHHGSPRTQIQVAGWADLKQPAFAQNRDLIGEGERFALIVGDQDGRDAR